MQHINIHISGVVQGVFFRASAKQAADELGVAGFVRNVPDGTVYIEAEGDEQASEIFLKWCENGPQTAKVEKVTVEKDEMRHFKTFDIL